MARKVNQIGIVVTEMDRAVTFYENFLGIEAIQVLERPPETCILLGEETHFRLKAGFARMNDLQIELIQVLEGYSPHSEFLEKSGGGVHHLGYFVEDIEAEVATSIAQEWPLYARGEFMGTKWAYVDTRSVLGIFQEFIELPKRKHRAEKMNKKEI